MHLSIVIPLFNCQEFLPECLDSLTPLNSKDTEIIVVNDGSTDESLKVAESFADKFENYQVFSQENAGAAAARNNGLRHAKGEYVFFCDSDDYIEAESFKRFFAKTRELSLDVSMANGRDLKEGKIGKKMRKDDEKKAYGLLSGPDYYLKTTKNKEFSINICLCLFRRDFLLEHGLTNPEGIMHEDEGFMPAVFMRAKKVEYFPEYFYIRRHRLGSVTKNAVHKYYNPKSSPSLLAVFNYLLSQSSPELDSSQNAVLNHALTKTYLEIIRREVYYKAKHLDELKVSSEKIERIKKELRSRHLPIRKKVKIWRYELKLKLTKAKA